jgi:hypothetical protein
MRTAVIVASTVIAFACYVGHNDFTVKTEEEGAALYHRYI